MAKLLLAGDIGGTKTILRFVEAGQGRPPGKTLAEKEYVSAQFDDLVPMVQAFAEEFAAVNLQPQAACFGIAGPVVHQYSRLTNLNWELSCDRLARELQIPSVSLINDFVAVGYGVLGLAETDSCYLQKGQGDPEAPIGVLGAGTGLGECFLAPMSSDESYDETRYQAFATEGGHTDFAPQSLIEFELCQYLRQREGLERVSVERIVSGQGIVSIYQFLRDAGYQEGGSAIADQIHEWETGSLPDLEPAGLIAQSAEQDSMCRKAMQLFMDAYAIEAGNLALKLLPNGGLYLAGGIAPKNLPWLQSDRFLSLLKSKGRVSHVLDEMPIAVVLNPKVGLIGAAIHAHNHL